ncbi:MAG: MFS transporter [Pseudomonadota bacterium]
MAIFLAFAVVYFFSALVRAVTATLAPVFSAELGLAAGQLGLLAGAYFLGFALMQLPLGSALDRWGAKRVLLAFVAVAVLGCAAFAVARDLPDLLLARWLIGVGVSACLMAPLTCFRHHFSAGAQLQANAWMLMTGSLGMLASTLPVQWMLPLLGWRGLFTAVAIGLALAMVGVAVLVPRDAVAGRSVQRADGAAGGYWQVFRHPAFLRVAPLGFFAYGGMVAMQSLWIGPWLTEVGGRSPDEAAQGLFLVNLCMLVAFFCWGVVMPRLTRAGWAGDRLIALTWPLGVGLLALIIWQAAQATAWMWALWCVCTSVVSLAQPAVAQQFPLALAGRALSAFNLVIFAGVFVLQWGIGLGIDAMRGAGLGVVPAYQLAFGGLALACALSFLWLNAWSWRQGRAAVPQSARR